MKRAKNILKQIFVTGAKITQENFHDLFDSYMHKDELDETLERMNQIVLDPGQAWRVDSDLDEGSTNPVQNKIVAERLRQLAASISTTNASLASTMGTLSEAISTIGTKADASALTQLQSAYDAFVSATNTALASKANASDVYTKAEHDSDMAKKVDIEQGVANAGKVMKVNSQGNLVPSEEGGKVKTVSVNGGTPVQPDGNGNINLQIEEGGGSLEGLSVNGTPVTPDQNGNVDLNVVEGVKLNGTEVQKGADGKVDIRINLPEVDETLDTTSTNPVRNSAVAAAINQLQNQTWDADVDQTDEGSVVTLSKDGNEVVQFTVAGGGGGGDSQSTKIVLTGSLSAATVKNGDSVVFTYHYDHGSGSGAEFESDGVKGDLTISVVRGATTLHTTTLREVTAGSTGTLDISQWLETGTIDVVLFASCTFTDGEGEQKTQTKTLRRSVTVLDLVLESSYNLTSAFGTGGYGANDSVVIPWSIRGSGEKVVTLYIDGEDVNSKTVTRSGLTNDSFTVAASTLAAGRHSVQLVAEVGSIKSNSIYFDILKAGGEAPFIGLKVDTAAGTIFTAEAGEPVWPTLDVRQYETLAFEWAAYDPASVSALVQEKEGDTVLRTISATRTVQTYTDSYKSAGAVNHKLVCGATEYPLEIVVAANSAINLAIAKTAYIALELDATGRSNSEADPAQWGYTSNVNNVQVVTATAFSGMGWNAVSGWNGESLVLKNGAAAVVGYRPFGSDPTVAGMCLEVEFRVPRIYTKGGTVMSCFANNKGIRITTEKISLLTGGTKTVGEGDDALTVASGVSTNYAEGEWVRAAFNISKRTGGKGLVELYVNGVRSAADEYSVGDNFVQDDAVGITIDSTSADVEVRIIRAYATELTDDEELENYIIDRQTASEIMALDSANAVTNQDGDIDIDVLRGKSRGVLIVSRSGGLAPVNAANDKKAKFYGDVTFYSPFGSAYDFHCVGCLVQIQGTSSTTYPRKNYRITLNKSQNGVPPMYVGEDCAKFLSGDNTAQTEVSKGNNKNKYAMRPGSIPINIFVMKKDFSDSSMTHNTGAAKLMNSVFKSMGILTPPQELNANFRTAIDGFPINIFSKDGNTVEYYGQYNFDNEKKNSGVVYGFDAMDDGDGGTLQCLCCLEFLNNSQPLCNFQAAGLADSQALADQLDAQFDLAFEFRYPEDDTIWNTDGSKPGATAAQKTAIKRLLGWLYSMKPAGAANDTAEANLSTWQNADFVSQVSQYFDIDNLLSWYIYTDYFMSVDQRAKNMMLATWDGLKWWFLFWDADTMLGDRNDSYLAYDYLMERDTIDPERNNKYAFEGHNSWLWNLVLANMQTQLRTVAASYRAAMSDAMVREMFDVEQQGQWSAREYNKGGEFTYILPQTEGVPDANGNRIWPYMFALKGTGEAHRHFTIANRFALLDAKYQCGGYRGDNLSFKLTRALGDAADVFLITSDEKYYYGYGTANNTYASGVPAEAGSTATLSITEAFQTNDPIVMYGASRIRELDLTQVLHFTDNLNISGCVKLAVLNMRAASATTENFYVNLSGCRRLESLDVTNRQNITTSSGSYILDLTNQTRLTTLKATGTRLTMVAFAAGAPVVLMCLPTTLQTLNLDRLQQLTNAGIRFTDSGSDLAEYASITTLMVTDCPMLDWYALSVKCTHLRTLQVDVGMSHRGDGTDLTALAARLADRTDSLTTCSFSGVYYLTRFLADDVKTLFTGMGLDIRDPEYTMIAAEEVVPDDANLTNLDNLTGFDYGTTYVPSGHISRILAKRHRVLAKLTQRPTSYYDAQNVRQNNADGVMTYYPLHDSHSGYYADAEALENCTTAPTDGTQGDVFIREPHYWYKGINDRLNGRHYTCYSSLEEEPARPAATVLQYADMVVTNNRKLATGNATLGTALKNDTAYAVCKVAVAGYSRVRFPSVPGGALLGAMFVDSEDNRISDVVVDTTISKTFNGETVTLEGGFVAGMYVIADIPTGAANLYFTILKSAEFDKVVLSNSDKIEDMEPDWVEVKPHLIAVTEAVADSETPSKLRSVFVSRASLGTTSQLNFHTYAQQRGMMLVDYEMHKDVGNLFFAKYGRRDSQAQCGYGTSTNSRPMGNTKALGMQDTQTVLGVSGNTGYRNSNEQWVGCDSPNVMGYQDWQGDKAEWMDRIGVNVGQVDGKCVISMPDKTQRRVPWPTSGHYIKAILHGKYCDTISADAAGGTETTFYCDWTNITASVGRVVCRSYYYASAGGGVSFANANNDSSVTGANIGSRLAFRGNLVKAESVEAFEAIEPVA